MGGRTNLLGFKYYLAPGRILFHGVQISNGSRVGVWGRSRRVVFTYLLASDHIRLLGFKYCLASGRSIRVVFTYLLASDRNRTLGFRFSVASDRIRLVGVIV